MNTLGILMAFIMGLTGSLHCAGMCGPMIWIMPFRSLTGTSKWLGIFLYHFGRVSMYAVLALILHSFRTAFNPDWQQIISILLGGSLLLMGFISFLPGCKLKMVLPWTGMVRSGLKKVIGRPSLTALFTVGLLNGLLPCGLVYMALTVSIAADTVFQSVLLMYAFGMGTIPMLLSITLLQGRIRFAANWNIRRIVPVVMLAFGSLFILRGLNLGIPYLSPGITIGKHEIKTNCCHKPTTDSEK